MPIKKTDAAALSRRDVIGMLTAGAVLFQARSVLGQTATVTPTVTPTSTPWKPTTGPLRQPLLSSLISDLLRKKGVRNRFNRDPEGTVELYDLTDAQKAAFYTMDKTTLHSFMTSESGNWLTAFNNVTFGEYWSYEDEAPDPAPCDNNLTTSYPDPKPEVFRFRPHSIKVGEPRTLVVFGQSFPPDATLELDPPAGISVATKRVAGTFRSSRLFAVVEGSAPGNDKYTVKVMRQGVLLASFSNCKLSVTA